MKIRSIRSRQQKQQELLDDAVIVYHLVRTAERGVDASYDPTSIVEDFVFPNTNAGRGSKVEELPL